MHILLIDNYDSFTYNVYQYLQELGHNVNVVRNNKISLDDVDTMNPDAVFISPGPGYPVNAGISIPMIQKFAGHISIFGICLGLQAIGEAFGGRIVHAKELIHGKTSEIVSFHKGVMSSFDRGITATRYHSLVVSKEDLPECFEITCETKDGEIMGLIHKKYNVEGVQFHPESIMTINGREVLKNFLDRTQLLLPKCSKKLLIKSLACLSVTKKHFRIPQTLNIDQYVKTMHMPKSYFTIFKRLQESLGREKVFILESAGGPVVDCQRTVIGVSPIFELTLDNNFLKINSDKQNIKEILNSAFRANFLFAQAGFDMKNKKFSEAFDLLSKTIKINKCHSANLNISSGLAGYFSYEYLHYLENIPRKPKRVMHLPDVHLKYFSILLLLDYNSNDLLIIENRIEDEKSMIDKICDIAISQTETLGNNKIDSSDIRSGESVKMKSNIDKETYIKGINKVKEYIRNGDIFQVQIGRRICINANIDPMVLYEKLRIVNPSPYMFYWDNGNYQLISDSPELQLRMDDGKITIRPIAGTSKGKGNNEEERKKILEAFVNDAKELAEHVMLVDLARNDIGIVAIEGSVNVSRLINVEEFSHVFHLVSTVDGRLKEGLNPMEVFEATFPAGTLTGAPKVRAMEIISEIEPENRGSYGGAFGFFDFTGNMVSSIIIRTILRIDENIYLQASAGIVADSVPEHEWDEINYKMKALIQVIADTVNFGIAKNKK